MSVKNPNESDSEGSAEITDRVSLAGLALQLLVLNQWPVRHHLPTVSHGSPHSEDNMLVTAGRLHRDPTSPQMKVKRPALRLWNGTIQSRQSLRKRFARILATR